MGILRILIITFTELIPTCNYIFTDLVPFYCLFPALDSKFYVSRDHVDFKHLSTLRVWHISVIYPFLNEIGEYEKYKKNSK